MAKNKLPKNLSPGAKMVAAGARLTLSGLTWAEKDLKKKRK